MVYYLLYPLHTVVPVFNVTRYITFRTAAASLTALALSLILGPWMIRLLHNFQIGQVIRQEGPQSHRAKAGTPTMGGLLILTASIVPTLLWADLANPYVWIAMLSTVGFGAVGGSLRPGDLVLVKGSRGTRTDIIADRIMAEFA